MHSEIITFGSFDPLHRGHVAMMQQATRYAMSVTVVVARDSTVKNKRSPGTVQVPQLERLMRVVGVPAVGRAQLGDTDPASYATLAASNATALALGYDQHVSKVHISDILSAAGKSDMEVIRLKAYRPQTYASSKVTL